MSRNVGVISNLKDFSIEMERATEFLYMYYGQSSTLMAYLLFNHFNRAVTALAGRDETESAADLAKLVLVMRNYFDIYIEKFERENRSVSQKSDYQSIRSTLFANKRL